MRAQVAWTIGYSNDCCHVTPLPLSLLSIFAKMQQAKLHIKMLQTRQEAISRLARITSVQALRLNDRTFLCAAELRRSPGPTLSLLLTMTRGKIPVLGTVLQHIECFLS